LEGGLKLVINSILIINRFISPSEKSIGAALLASVTKGLIVFILVLASLASYEYFSGLIIGESRVILDTIDVFIAAFGFILMFMGKLLECLYGKNR
jgi:uncharacterized membrane protein